MTQSLEDLLRNVCAGKETVFDVTAAVDTDGQEFKRVSVGHRVLPPVPYEEPVAPADARQHVFHSIEQFGEYVVRNAEKDHCVVLADTDDRMISAVLDESSETDREVIHFQAKMHPLFLPWAKLMGNETPVIDFAKHVMVHRSAISEPDGRDVALTFSQVKSSKKIIRRSGLGPKAINGVMIEIQIGSESKEVEADLPERLTIDVPLFLDTDPMEVHLDLLVHEGRSGGLVVSVAAPEVEMARIKAFESMVQTLRTQTGLLVSLGEVSHREFKRQEMTPMVGDF